jgi:hypothetical protein
VGVAHLHRRPIGRLPRRIIDERCHAEHRASGRPLAISPLAATESPLVLYLCISKVDFDDLEQKNCHREGNRCQISLRELVRPE